jgi:Tubulin like
MTEIIDAAETKEAFALHRFLVVGCGGSGGATLSYMLDQLRSDLAAHGIDRIPTGWQFVHVDVPMEPDPGPERLKNVVRSGGSYVPLGLASGRYSELDEIVSTRVSDRGSLDSIGSWAPPDPSRVTIPLTNGAGQMRAVGRMLTLHKLQHLRAQLEAAWGRLSAADIELEMSRLHEFGSYDSERPPIVLVVSSMAGGAGASMALDVCRVLSSLPNYIPGNAGVFMVGADVFQSIPAADRTGVMPNALAMFGEIVASQTGEAVISDEPLLRALGLSQVGVAVPFARVFPVNLYQGGDRRTIVGDGTPKAVYRALARGLSSLMTSPQATFQFVQFDLTNETGSAYNQKLFGWGSAAPKSLEWGSFGFASLSMGRDRFAEYAAQRLARHAIDRMVEGHLSDNAHANGLEQLQQRTAQLWPRECGALGLWAGSQSAYPLIGNWLMGVAWPEEETRAVAHQIARSQITDILPVGGGSAADWIDAVKRRFSEARPGVSQAVEQAAHGWGERWATDLFEKTQEVVARSIEQYGLAYAHRLVQLAAQHVASVIMPRIRELAASPSGEVEADAGVVKTVAGSKGALSNAEKFIQALSKSASESILRSLYVSSARLMQQLLQGYVDDVLSPLDRELGARLQELSVARGVAARRSGVAHVETAVVSEWPRESEQSPDSRWSVAANDVLVMTTDHYGLEFKRLVEATAEKPGLYAEALEDLVGHIISGNWSTQDGTTAPRDLVTVMQNWVPVAVALNTSNGKSQIAGFDVRSTPSGVLNRARAFIARTGTAFHAFTSESLRSYASSSATMEEVSVKFQQTLTRALPLAKVSSAMVLQLYGQEVSYRYKFSQVPFNNHPLGGVLRSLLENGQGIETASVAAFEEAQRTGSQNATRIDVFGSYPCYAPVCFDSVFDPILGEWNEKKGTFRQGDFWHNRKARTLPGVLPVTGVERRALIAGWFLAQLLGRISFPLPPYGERVEPVRIWVSDDPSTDDPAGPGEWRAFVDFPLTRVDEMRSTSSDWLPLVLEGILVAMASAHEDPVFESMRPYRALREIFDTDPAGARPAEKALNGTLPLHAQGLLENWLMSGVTPTGGASRIVIPEGSTDPAGDRLKGARAFLATRANMFRKEFLPGTGAFGRITDRRKASEMPLMRDIVDDAMTALDLLERVLTLASKPDDPRDPNYPDVV